MHYDDTAHTNPSVRARDAAAPRGLAHELRAVLCNVLRHHGLVEHADGAEAARAARRRAVQLDVAARALVAAVVARWAGRRDVHAAGAVSLAWPLAHGVTRRQKPLAQVLLLAVLLPILEHVCDSLAAIQVGANLQREHARQDQHDAPTRHLVRQEDGEEQGGDGQRDTEHGSVSLAPHSHAAAGAAQRELDDGCRQHRAAGAHAEQPLQAPLRQIVKGGVVVGELDGGEGARAHGGHR
mmetsp:Transcript_20315/g.71860  ORF Transcript_20315/g.71860 Transcript_20315/m.71860 type:complete len:239 (-) Transcript_20315:1092-1808(-)